jgi:peptidoglycan hydrolase CwlO-like protein
MRVISKHYLSGGCSVVLAKRFGFFIIIAVIIALISANILSGQVLSQVQPITEVEEKLQDISEIEKTVLENLFTLSQQIEETERQKEKISAEVQRLRSDSEKLAKEIEEKQNTYNSQLNVLKKVLVSYQRKGPASFLETILKSENLSDFIQSLNIIRQISRNTDELLNRLESRKKELVSENEKLKAKEEELEKYIAELQNTLDEMYALREEQETILNSVGEAREMYQNELQRLQQEWNDLKVLFSEIVEYFTEIAKRGDFPVEALNLKISFPKISGKIYDQTLNSIWEKQSDLPKMVFEFRPEGIWVNVPEKQLSLRGIFKIENKTLLKFEVEEGTFCGMPLTEASIAELFKNGQIVINFEEIMAGSVTLESVEVFDGYLEFVITPSF